MRWLALLAVLPSLQGGHTTPICGKTSIPYPQHALAVSSGSVWAACRERGALVRLTPAGKQVASIPLGVRPWAVAAGGGALWVVDRDQALALRVDPRRNRVTRRVSLPSAPIDVWVGAGSVWLALDAQGAVGRLGRTLAVISTGDGPSGFATDGRTVWIANHRDGTLSRIAPGAARATTISRPGAERLVYLADSLWATGRGLDLLRIDPQSGATQTTVEIGAAGIELAVAGGRVWAGAATEAGARRGDPRAAALVAVNPSTNTVVESHAATAPLMLNGLATDGRRLWVADLVHGALVGLG